MKDAEIQFSLFIFEFGAAAQEFNTTQQPLF